MTQNRAGIVVHAGHDAIIDPGAISNGYKEADLTIELRGIIANWLVNNTEGIAIKTDNDNHRLIQVMREYNAASDKNTVAIELHFNAAIPQATGTEVFISERHTFEELEFAKKLAAMVSSVLTIRNRGVKTEKQSNRGKLYISQMNGCNLLLEVCFMTNPNDLAKYQLYKEHLGEEIGRILVEAYQRLNEEV